MYEEKRVSGKNFRNRDGVWYDLRIDMFKNTFRCYVDSALMLAATNPGARFITRDGSVMEMRLRFLPEYVTSFRKVFGTEWPRPRLIESCASRRAAGS